jgi:UDP-glucose 4-epimerase
LETIALRYFNVYGPRQDPTSDYAAVIPKFITNISNDKPPVIFGDGNQTRDFTFVEDVVQANIKAAESSASGVFNIAVGNRITINSLAELVMKFTKKNLEIVYDPPRPGDIKHSLADVSRAKNHFYYKPEFDIKNGLEETIKWFQKED